MNTNDVTNSIANIMSNSSIYPSLLASAELLASFLQKYGENQQVNMSRAATAEVEPGQQHQQGTLESNNIPLDLSSTSRSNPSVAPPNHHHHVITSMMNDYRPRSTTVSIDASNAPSPVMTVDENCDSFSPSSSSPSQPSSLLCPPHHTTSCSNRSHMHDQNMPFEDTFVPFSTDDMSDRQRQKRFNRFVKMRFVEEFSPIEFLSYKTLKRNHSIKIDQIKYQARDLYLPRDVTADEFKTYWKSALNTIRQTRYRYKSRAQYEKLRDSLSI